MREPITGLHSEPPSLEEGEKEAESDALCHHDAGIFPIDDFEARKIRRNLRKWLKEEEILYF